MSVVVAAANKGLVSVGADGGGCSQPRAITPASTAAAAWIRRFIVASCDGVPSSESWSLGRSYSSPRSRSRITSSSEGLPYPRAFTRWMNPRDAVVAGPAQLLQRQPLVARLFQRRDVGWIHAVVARLHEILGVRRRVAHLLHVRDVVPIDTVIPQAHECLGAQVLVACAVQ